MSLTLTLKGRLIMETGFHIPVFFPSWLPFESSEWLLRGSALFLVSVWTRSTHRLPQTHRHQHKYAHTHTQPLDTLRRYEVPSHPPHSLALSISLSHWASVDCVPRGTSNPADVTSVGQQQTSPGGTTAERTTGTAQRVRLQHPHKDTHTQHLELLLPFVKICCWVALKSCTDLQATINFADHMSNPWL